MQYPSARAGAGAGTANELHLFPAPCSICAKRDLPCDNGLPLCSGCISIAATRHVALEDMPACVYPSDNATSKAKVAGAGAGEGKVAGWVERNRAEKKKERMDRVQALEDRLAILERLTSSGTSSPPSTASPVATTSAMDPSLASPYPAFSAAPSAFAPPVLPKAAVQGPPPRRKTSKTKAQPSTTCLTSQQPVLAPMPSIATPVTYLDPSSSTSFQHSDGRHVQQQQQHSSYRPGPLQQQHQPIESLAKMQEEFQGRWERAMVQQAAAAGGGVASAGRQRGQEVVPSHTSTTAAQPHYQHRRQSSQSILYPGSNPIPPLYIEGLDPLSSLDPISLQPSLRMPAPLSTNPFVKQPISMDPNDAFLQDNGSGLGSSVGSRMGRVEMDSASVKRRREM